MSNKQALNRYVEAVGPEERHGFDPENAESILRHWRKSSHDQHINVILAVVEHVAGAECKAWAKEWFDNNVPQWLSFAELLPRPQ